jgi:hypothetical protein
LRDDAKEVHFLPIKGVKFFRSGVKQVRLNTIEPRLRMEYGSDSARVAVMVVSAFKSYHL